MCPVLVHAQTTVPNVVGMSQANAEGAITGAGLVASSSLEYAIETAGNVFFQSPSGGSVVSAGSTVSLKVSRGSVTPEAYNYQGLIYSLLGIAGGMSFVIGIRCGGA
ncbi:MAG: PASTA domain-containing protein [Syntrophobacteraceae bacterium]